MSPCARRSLAAVLGTLERQQGKVPKPISKDPFHLVLFEQVAYLVPEPRRRGAFKRLAAEVGLTPAAILGAGKGRLESIARDGGAIAAPTRAERMRESARRVLEDWDGDLRSALSLPLPKARRALAAFPMIGPPGADRILAVTGAHAVLGLDSNGLRTLLRLGWGREARGYAASYRSVQSAIADELPKSPERLAAASALLKVHGETVCRRSEPECGICPLTGMCAYFKAHERMG